MRERDDISRSVNGTMNEVGRGFTAGQQTCGVIRNEKQ